MGLGRDKNAVKWVVLDGIRHDVPIHGSPGLCYTGIEVHLDIEDKVTKYSVNKLKELGLKVFAKIITGPPEVIVDNTIYGIPPKFLQVESPDGAAGIPRRSVMRSWTSAVYDTTPRSTGS